MDDTITYLGLLEDEEIALDDAALTIAALDHPGIELAPYEEVLDAIAMRLDDVASDAASGAARAAALARVIADEFGFIGDAATYDDPDNADLIRVIDRRRGLPVSLSILYVALARRLGWVADALNVPGHVLVLVGDDVAPIVIDPFRGGMEVDPAQFAMLMAASSGGAVPAVNHVATMPNRTILARLLANQATRAEQAGKGRRALTVYTRITAIAPDYGQAWWDRARLELIDGDVPAAKASLNAMLEMTRDPAIRAQVTDMLGALAAA